MRTDDGSAPDPREIVRRIDEALAEIDAVQEELLRDVAGTVGGDDAAEVAGRMRRHTTRPRRRTV